MKPLSMQLVREANPVPDADRAVNVVVRERTFQHVFQTQLVQPFGRKRRSRVLVAVVLASLGFAAAALAASGILAGASYRVPGAPSPNRNPGVGAGITVSGSARLLALRVPDPAGGPPWGMRVLQTTRGLECVQVGRIVNGQLGVLGQDGVAGDDHRFHALAPALVSAGDCALPDANQHAFIDNETDTAYANGPVFTPSSCARPGDGSSQPPCPASDRRTLAYGLLGPNAHSLTYRAGGQTVTEATVGRDGGYLVVMRPPPGPGNIGLAQGSADLFPGALAVTFKNGRRCRPQPAISCARNGYTAPESLRVPAARIKVHTEIRRYQTDGNSYTELLVSFRAPIAITNANRSYTLATTLPPACGATDYATIDRDIKRGARITIHTSKIPNTCPGTATANLQVTQTNPYLAGPGSVITSLSTITFKLATTPGNKK